MKILMIILLTFLFSGCAEKVIFKDKLVCTQQLTVPRTNADIRIHQDDLEIATRYKESNDSALNFYEKQVEQNNLLCKDLK